MPPFGSTSAAEAFNDLDVTNPAVRRVAWELAHALQTRDWDRLLCCPEPITPSLPRRWQRLQQSNELTTVSAVCASYPEFTSTYAAVIAEWLLKADPPEPEPEPEDEPDKPDDSPQLDTPNVPPLAGECEAQLQEIVQAALEEGVMADNLGLSSAMQPAIEQTEEAANLRARVLKMALEHPSIQRILALAGRVAQHRWDAPVAPSPYGQDTLDGIEKGGEISRAVASSLMGLRHRLLRLLVLKDLVERQLQQYRYVGEMPMSLGPILLVVDVSISMASGPPPGLLWAEGLNRMLAALGIAVGALRAARAKRRPFGLVLFGASVLYEHYGSGLADYTAILERLLTPAASPGTDIDAALNAALDQEKAIARDGADIVFVTDGEDAVNMPVIKRFLDVRRRYGVRLFYVHIGGTENPVLSKLAADRLNLWSLDDVDRLSTSLLR